MRPLDLWQNCCITWPCPIDEFIFQYATKITHKNRFWKSTTIPFIKDDFWRHHFAENFACVHDIHVMSLKHSWENASRIKRSQEITRVKTRLSMKISNWDYLLPEIYTLAWESKDETYSIRITIHMILSINSSQIIIFKHEPFGQAYIKDSISWLILTVGFKRWNERIEPLC